VLAVARLGGFAAQSDDEHMAETEDRAEALRLKLVSRRDSRRRVPEELGARIRKALQVDRVGAGGEVGDVDAVVPRKP